MHTSIRRQRGPGGMQPSSTTESLAPNGDNHLVLEHIFLLQMQCHADDFYLERRASPGALPEIP
jgi:hypothetical protein